jgi:hypothetical protein
MLYRFCIELCFASYICIYFFKKIHYKHKAIKYMKKLIYDNSQALL